MSARLPLKTLPLRRWLALAMVTTFFVPVVITGALVAHFLTSSAFTVDDAAQLLREDTPRWTDRAWQAETTDELAAEGIDFVLMEDRREIYRSTPDPLAGAGDEERARLVRTLNIATSEPRLTAHIYGEQGSGDGGPPGDPPFWLVPLVGLTSLLVTLGSIAWFLGRMVVKPLAATSDAARRVATGNLDVALPSSRVREVAEVNTAFEAMGAELRASLEHQAELEQERRLFIGAIVHDLRTPLFSLRGYLEGLEQGVADTPEKRARYVAVAQEKAGALERLITDLFDYTRMEYLDQAPNREAMDLAALLGRLVDGLQPQAEIKEIMLTLDTPAEGCTVDGDAHLLTRAVENLLDNALRYTPNGGRVRVECRADATGVRFSVADSGPGIPVDDLPHLFAPLFRGETSRNRRTGGAGLGLTTARNIIRAHGGELTARNHIDGGAIFTGTLPRVEPPTPDGASLSRRAAPSPRHAEHPPRHAELVEASGFHDGRPSPEPGPSTDSEAQDDESLRR
ncbi:MAG: sensor histidine kinase [Thermomicrobiales bacterium]